MKPLNEIKKDVEEILKPIFVSEWVRCKKCGHSIESHYWNSGGRAECSGYDSCREGGCKCVYDENETEIVESVAEEALETYTKELTDYITKSNREAHNSAIDRVMSVIEGYFKGLIAIPDPQKTKESLIGYIYSLKDISVNLSQLNKGNDYDNK